MSDPQHDMQDVAIADLARQLAEARADVERLREHFRACERRYQEQAEQAEAEMGRLRADLEVAESRKSEVIRDLKAEVDRLREELAVTTKMYTEETILARRAEQAEAKLKAVVEALENIDRYGDSEEVGSYCTGCASTRVNHQGQPDEHEPDCAWLALAAAQEKP